MATITELPKTSLTFEQKLDRLAQVAVNAGLGLERGQELVMTATLDALPLARLITEQAYKAGASLVTTLFTDEQSTLLRYRYAEDAGFDKAAGMALRGNGTGIPQRRGAACDCRRKSLSAFEGRSGKGWPGEPRSFEGLSSRDRAHYPA